MITVFIVAIILLIVALTGVANSGGFKNNSPTPKSIVSARITFSDLFQLISNEIGNIFGGNSNKAIAHNKAGSQNQKVCISCHGDMITKKTPWHKLHISSRFTDFECTTCHTKKIDTGPRGLGGKVNIDRKICKTCHKGKFSAYSKDHQKRSWVSQHKSLRGEKTGGVDIYSMEMLAEKYPECFICHKKKELNFCKNCHEFHPHNDAWINGGHGKKAVATDFSCLRCHDKNTWCTTQCHSGVTLPHNIPRWSKHYVNEPDAPQWRRIHPDVALAAQTNASAAGSQKIVCFLCHGKKSQIAAGDTNNFCQDCHHSRFNAFGVPGPIWKTRHPTVVKELGSSKCQKCHLLEFCAYCHTNGQKPARGMFFNRRVRPTPVDADELKNIRD